MEFQFIRVEPDDPAVHVILNRPEKINALSMELLEELGRALREIAAGKWRAVVLRGEGRHLCAGHDLAEIAAMPPLERTRLFDTCVDVMNLMQTIPQPIIAQVHGIATAAGCQLVAACDMGVAEENARFATPGVKIGLFCSTPMVPLVRAVGRKRAFEMLLTGRYVPAREALDWGLINRVTRPDELAAATRELVTAIAEASPLTVGFGKRAFYEQIDLPEGAAYDLTKHAITTNLGFEDAQEGIRAFVEKRAPVWRNR